MDDYDGTKEKEIDILAMFFYILNNWRKIVLVALVFALLLGGYRVSYGFKTLKDFRQDNNRNKVYQSELTTYNMAKKNIEKELKNLKGKIDSQKKYNNSSILMQINPLDEKVASAFMYISTDYKINTKSISQGNDSTDMIVNAYTSYAQYGDLYNYILENLSEDVEVKYLKEIISITSDYDANMVYIKVINNDSKLCKTVFNLILEYIHKEYDNICTEIGNHTIKVLDQSYESVLDFDLIATQQKNMQILSEYEKDKNDKTVELNALVSPEKVVISVKTIIKSIFKYVILGFAAGSLFSITIITIGYVTSNKLYRIEDIIYVHKLRVLGIYNNNLDKRPLFYFIDQLLKKLENKSYVKLEKEEELNIISSSIEAIIEIENINKGKIVITGTLENEKINDVYNRFSEKLKNLTYEFILSTNINNNADTIAQIRSCAAVILVEEIGKSNNNEIQRQLSSIYNLKKEIIGVVLVQ